LLLTVIQLALIIFVVYVERWCNWRRTSWFFHILLYWDRTVTWSLNFHFRMKS